MRIGNVYRLYCQTTKPPKEKYLILVANRNYPVFFFINSEISQFIQHKNLTHTQIPILKDDHPFLRYDSWVCTHLPCGEFPSNYITDNNIAPLGSVSDQLLRRLRGAVESSRTIRMMTKAWILEDVDVELSLRGLGGC